MTDVSQFYRRAQILPYVTIAFGCVGAWAMQRWTLMNPFEFPGSFLSALCLTGGYAAIPYTLYLLVLWYFVRPSSERTMQMAARLAPLLIAPPLALFMLIRGIFADPIEGALTAAGFFFAATLIVGYAHVILIELLLALLKRLGWIHFAANSAAK